MDSAVIKLTLYKEPPIKVLDEGMLFKVIKAAFAQRRKTLLNSLCSNLNLDKEEVKSLLVSLGFDLNIRGEVLKLEEFAKIADALIAL